MRSSLFFVPAAVALLSCTKHALAAALQQPVRLAHRASPTDNVSELKSYCSDLKASCADVCVEDQRGLVSIVFACSQEKSGLFEFGCSCGGVDHTQDALKRVAQPATTRATTSLTTTTALPSTLSLTSTETDTEYISTDTDATAQATSYDVHTFTQVPYTYVTVTAGTSTSTSFTQVGTTTFSTISLQATKRALAGSEVRVWISKVSKRASATFANAFSQSCISECKAVGSSVSKQDCTRTTDGKTSDEYSLVCQCKNKKDLTIHALKGVTDPIVKQVTVLTTKTSTARTPSTKTSVVPASTTTSISVITQVPTVTESGSTTITVQDTFTQNTATVSQYAYTILTEDYTNTYTQTVTATATKAKSTTLKLLAPTGRVRIDLATDNSSATIGRVAEEPNYQYLVIANASQDDGVRYGLMLLPSDGTGVPIYALTNMAYPGQRVWTMNKVVDDWNTTTYCQSTFLRDQTLFQYVTYLSFRLGKVKANTNNSKRPFELPIFPHQVLSSGESVSPPLYEYTNNGAGINLGRSPTSVCKGDPYSIPINAVFEPDIKK